jgi:hypothetical protein
VYNKCVILLSKWVTLNAAPCNRKQYQIEITNRFAAFEDLSDDEDNK